MENKNIKIITLWPAGVGKTSIINRIITKNFHANQISTIAIENTFIEKEYKKKNIILKLNFIDTAGQERYMYSLPKSYIHNSQIILLVFDTLENLEILRGRWFSYYKENADVNNSLFLVVGNKSDLFGDDREKILNLANEFADEIDAFFVTCSAKSNDNIDNLENHILKEAKRLIDNEKSGKNKDSSSGNNNRIILGEMQEKKKCGC